MRPRSALRATLLALPVAAFACAAQPNFSYYDDLEGGEAGAHRPDGSAPVEASATDATAGDDGAPPADDASGDAPVSDGGGSDDGETEASVDGGCGPLDNASNCGACGVACDMTNSNSASCTLDAGAAACSYASCATGFADCDASAPNTNGCETPITTIDNCGACGVACNPANSVDAGCGPTGCTYACAPGFADCDAAPPNANGCSTPITTATNCGACGVACNPANTVDAGCGPAGCTYACAPNFANCDTTSAPGNTGGCACNTPACCSAPGATPGVGGPSYTCETTHSDGVGQSYYSCTAVGTYNQAEALAACEAYVTSIGVATSSCEGPAACSVSGHSTTYDGIFYLNASTVTGYIWIYATLSGATAGMVYPASTFCSGHPGGVAWN